jgi:hypothetical protein
MGPGYHCWRVLLNCLVLCSSWRDQWDQYIISGGFSKVVFFSVVAGNQGEGFYEIDFRRVGGGGTNGTNILSGGV